MDTNTQTPAVDRDSRPSTENAYTANGPRCGCCGERTIPPTPGTSEEGYYCEGCGAAWTDPETVVGPCMLHRTQPAVVSEPAGQAAVSEDLARTHYLFINMRDIGCSGCGVRYDVVGRDAAEGAHAEHLASLVTSPEGTTR